MISYQINTEPYPEKYALIHKDLKAKNILGEITPRENFPDEPQFYLYACERAPGETIKRKFGYGCSQDKPEAYTIAVAEAIEYYCITHASYHQLIRDTYRNLHTKAVDPLKFKRFTDEQLSLQRSSKFRVNHDTPLHWIQGKSLTDGTQKYIPAQLVFASYDAEEYQEPLLEFPNSNGSACGPTEQFVIYKGLCELIERDAHMINFINGLKRNIIDFDDGEYQAFLRRVTRYDLEVYPLDFSLDFSPTAVTCIVLDKSGIGPAVNTGLGCDVDPLRATKTAIYEAVRDHISRLIWLFRGRPRRMAAKHTQEWFIARKSQWWASPFGFRKISPFLSGGKTLLKATSRLTTPPDLVKAILNEFTQKGYEVYAVDLTIPEVAEHDLKVIKVLCPDLVPLWKDERYPYRYSRRLYEVPVQLGLRSTMLKESEIDPSHPF